MARTKAKATVTLPKGVRQISDHKFMVQKTIPNIGRFSAVGTTPEEAEENWQKKLSEAVIAAHNGTGTIAIVQAGGWTLEKAYEKANAIYWEGKSSQGTNYWNAQASFKFFGKDRLVCTISQKDIDNYVAHLKTQRNANGTINRKMSALSRMLEVSEDNGHLQKKPKMRRAKEGIGRIRVMDFLEEIQLMDCLDSLNAHAHKEAVIFLLDMGFRPKELWMLEAGQVNFPANQIELWKTKTDRPRAVPMTTRVREMMLRRCELHPEGQLIPGAGKAWMRTVWNRCREMMGLSEDKEFTPYVCRHTCCTRWVEADIKLAKVQKMMGHTDIRTTLRYTHLKESILQSEQVKVESYHEQAMNTARMLMEVAKKKMEADRAAGRLPKDFADNPKALEQYIKILAANEMQVVAEFDAKTPIAV